MVPATSGAAAAFSAVRSSHQASSARQNIQTWVFHRAGVALGGLAQGRVPLRYRLLDRREYFWG